MSIAERVADAAMESDEQLRGAINDGVKTLGVSVKGLSEVCGLSISTIYKLLSGEREPNLRTLRAKEAQHHRGEARHHAVIAIVASRPVLDLIKTPSIDVDNKKIPIKEYAAASVEEAILAAVAADRDGAKALICAPIVAKTVEGLVAIPTVAIQHSEEGLMSAIVAACGKVAWS